MANLANTHQHLHFKRISALGLIVTLGIVFGDIGTSPLYVMKAVVASTPNINFDFILGAISCVIWTLTLQTTLKYVIITLKADNKGEGGILALYALVRRNKKSWVYMVAIIGACALIADGIITPSITVVSAIEGLVPIYPNIPIVPIVLVILLFLFLFQQFGTHSIGKSFGPIMFFWFLILGILGFSQIIEYPLILKAFNPYYAIELIINHPHCLLILGAVFLCTTGAEALYSDLGHCGIKNIRITWFYVKLCLILNYLGQGAWIMTHQNMLTENVNPFFASMPQWFLIFGVLFSTAAAIIASQALISGSFTIISEATILNFWPRQKIKYPSEIKGQLYIPFVNWFLFFACCFVVIYFKNSSSMEAAYGLSITITMLMTTILLLSYLKNRNISKFLIIGFGIIYITIESGFLVANVVKFIHGGWLPISIMIVLGTIMFVWFNTRRLKNKYMQFIKLKDYSQTLIDIKEDKSIPKFATNLVYLTKADRKTDIENKILYSIINKHPKRADAYWILHVNYVDEPYKLEYSFEPLIPNTLYRVDMHFGFKMQPLINLYFKQVIQDLVNTGEFDIVSNYPSLRKNHIDGDFKFVMINAVANYDHEFTFREKLTINLFNIFKHIGITDIKAFGLDTSNVIIESVPLVLKKTSKNQIVRITKS